MFSIQNLQYSYSKEQALIQISDWQANQGEAWVLLGASGSGKTTILHLLGGLLKPQTGKLVIAGQDITHLKGTNLDKFRARHIGLIFQRPHLVKTLTVLQNLLLAQYMAGFRQDKKQCEEVLSKLQIASKKNAFPHQLSQGEAQRVSVARAVLHHPSILLADEPTASLDDANALQVIEMLQTQAHAYRATLVIATHDKRVSEVFEKCYRLNSTQ